MARSIRRPIAAGLAPVPATCRTLSSRREKRRVVSTAPSSVAKVLAFLEVITIRYSASSWCER